MTKDQHYIPKTYLKRFVNSNDEIYRLLKANRKAKPHIKHYSPAGTGYSHWFYTIKDENILRRYNIDSPNFIEEFFARNHDKECNRLLDVFLQPDLRLSIDGARTLMQFVLSFKARNPALRLDFADIEVAKYTYDNRLAELEAQLRAENVSTEQLGGKTIDAFIASLRAGVYAHIESPGFATNVHTEGILSSFSGKSTVIDEVVELLLTFEWRVMVTNPDQPFITSDNPGFTIDAQNQPHNLNFNEAMIFGFPLSPLHCLLLIRNMEGQSTNKAYIDVDYISPDDPMYVRAINRATFRTSYKFIYSNLESVLEQTWRDVQNGIMN
jgi:hypothetical protein